MKTVEFEFDVQDKVQFRFASEIDGRVTAMKVEYCGLMYRVAWWHEGHRNEDWFLAWELKRG